MAKHPKKRCKTAKKKRPNPLEEFPFLMEADEASFEATLVAFERLRQITDEAAP